jgi:hypothetical protein
MICLACNDFGIQSIDKSLREIINEYLLLAHITTARILNYSEPVLKKGEKCDRVSLPRKAADGFLTGRLRVGDGSTRRRERRRLCSSHPTKKYMTVTELVVDSGLAVSCVWTRLALPSRTLPISSQVSVQTQGSVLASCPIATMLRRQNAAPVSSPSAASHQLA